MNKFCVDRDKHPCIFVIRTEEHPKKGESHYSVLVPYTSSNMLARLDFGEL